MGDKEANAVYGAYTALVYMTPFFGGMIADKLIGARSSVIIGGLFMAAGHLLMTFQNEIMFFSALGLLIIGNGFFKPNISTIVGKLYADDDKRQDSGFTIFYMSINIGSTIGYGICGYLGEKVGWHWGFGAAGVGMIFGVFQYIRNRHLLGDAGASPNPMPEERRQKLLGYTKIAFAIVVVLFALVLTGVVTVEPTVFAENFAYFLTTLAGVYFIYLYFFAGLNVNERKNITLLFLLFIAAAAFWSGFDQSGGSLNIFARDYTDLTYFDFTMPVSWVQFINPIYVVIFAPIFAGLWAQLARRNLDPSLPLKFVIGLVFMGISFLIMLVAVDLALESAPIGLQWLLLTYLFQTWGELALSPIGLSAFARYSPKKYVGQMFGLWFLASAIGGVMAGLLGGEALGDGLNSMSPVFSYMIKYYFVIAVVLVFLSYIIGRKAKSSEEPG